VERSSKVEVRTIGKRRSVSFADNNVARYIIVDAADSSGPTKLSSPGDKERNVILDKNSATSSTM
jgi:hypothetical protein